VHLTSALDTPAAPSKKEIALDGPSLESTNVLRPPPAVVATAATSPAAAMPIPPKPIPSPVKVPGAIAPPPAIVSSTNKMPAALTIDSMPPLALGGHSDKGILGNTSPLTAMLTVGGSLSIVLGLFLVVAWAMRKTAPRGSLRLPKEVFEILGRAPLGARQQVQLLRCGSKLLLVSITPHGTETLTEVTDPLEVDRIAGICQQGNPKSSTVAFRQVFQQLATKPAAEPEPLELGGARRKRYRWEKEHA
jgi:flagellar biogenesis protein FliO